MDEMSFPGYRETCFFCKACWGKCTCSFVDYLDDLDGFDWHEFFITSPNVSVCGRFFVDPVVYYGEPFNQWWREKGALQE